MSGSVFAMSYPSIVLLPGLDGTADLFTSFVAAAPGGLQLQRWAWRARPPRALVRAFMTGGNSQLADTVVSAVSRVDRAVISERLAEVLRVNVTEELAELTTPVLYVRATRDRLIGVKSAEQSRIARPSTRIVEVNAPHLVLQVNPRDAWKCIQPFIEEVTTTDRARAG